MALCPLCRKRKPRRFCPARREEICAICCGTKRRVEIACPSDCPYLQSAERHPAAVVKRRQEHDFDVLRPTLEGLNEQQLQLFLLVVPFIARFAPSGLGRLLDVDVAEAVGALAATYETSSRGIIYEHRSSSAVAEELRRAIQEVLTELARGEGSRFDREIVGVLRGIQRGARHDAPGLADASERGYIELLERLSQVGPGPGERETAGGESGIILP